MRDENPSENHDRTVKFADQNQAPKNPNGKTNSGVIPSKPRSSWGFKGFAADKRTKAQSTVISKKIPLSNSQVTIQKNSFGPAHSRVKRSLIRDLSCTVNNAAQVHPQAYQAHRRQSSGSRDLFLELDSLRTLLQESKEREFNLQADLSEWERNPKVLELERELEAKKNEADDLVSRVGLLEDEKTNLSEQLAAMSLILERKSEGENAMNMGSLSPQNLEMEVVELRRLNKKLEMEKRNLARKLSSMEYQMTSLAKIEIVAKVKAEVTLLRHTNEDLCKQVEGLQMSRLNEVEELAYLRWVNGCLRDELRNSCTTMNSEKVASPNSTKKTSENVGSLPYRNDECSEYSSEKKLNFIKKLKKWSNASEEVSNTECQDNLFEKIRLEEVRSPRWRGSISGSNCSVEELMPNKRRQSDGFMCTKEMENEEESVESGQYDFDMVQRPQFSANCLEVNRTICASDGQKRALRIPNPPPRPSCSLSSGPKEECSAKIPQPPPLPPPPHPPLAPQFSGRSTTGVVQRAPQVVEFYHSLMKRDSRKDSSNGGISEAPDVANVRSSMIGEIENRSSHLLAIKADVATQGEFVKSLIREVNNAVYQNIDDVVAFVKWLDDELCFLVDERAVLKHFDWPEKKADILREAAFGYRDLKKLESEVSHYKDDPRLPCDLALKKMVGLSEKMERTVYNHLRTRESLMRNYKEFQIPTDWMLDNGIMSKIKLGSVKLAKKYMKRVALELHSKTGSEKDPAMDYMLLHAVRFAFRIHQFAGGFDAETMHSFEELRNIAHLLNKK